MDAGKEIKSGWHAIKNHWVFFLLAFLAIAIVVLWYDFQNSGKLTTKVAQWPVVGNLFKSKSSSATA